MKKIIIGTLIFILVSFIVQALSHFVINVAHFASISFMRSEPIMTLGIFTMIIQGVVLSYFYRFYKHIDSDWKTGLKYGLLIGAFFVSYIALVEPSKYQVPNITNWILVESIAGLIQFSLFGILLGIAYHKLEYIQPLKT